jgi:hypothetical protein
LYLLSVADIRAEINCLQRCGQHNQPVQNADECVREVLHSGGVDFSAAKVLLFSDMGKSFGIFW